MNATKHACKYYWLLLDKNCVYMCAEEYKHIRHILHLARYRSIVICHSEKGKLVFKLYYITIIEAGFSCSFFCSYLVTNEILDSACFVKAVVLGWKHLKSDNVFCNLEYIININNNGVKYQYYLWIVFTLHC